MSVRVSQLVDLTSSIRFAAGLHPFSRIAQSAKRAARRLGHPQQHRHAAARGSAAFVATAQRGAQMHSLDGFSQRIAECNTAADAELVPFHAADTCVGYLRPKFAEQLAGLPQFTAHRDVENTGSTAPTLISLRAAHDSQEARSEALAGAPVRDLRNPGSWKCAEATAALRDRGVITGWRDELYPVTGSFHAEPLALIERAAAPHFGIKAYGVHVNGYVLREGRLRLWVARRSRAKPTWPGLLDHIVAGGQPAGLSCMDNVVKECQEEASIPADLARTARPAGVVSYSGMVTEGLKRDVLFVYDILLPDDFQPTPQDGEVEAFELKPIEEVARLVAHTQDFKPNCALVITDFLVRHGVLSPEQPGYAQLVSQLRSGDCS